MNKLPGAKHGVTFGAADKPLPDWRKNKVVMDESDPDDEEIETPEDVKAVLGFDPKDESDDDMSTTTTTDKPKPSLRDALLRRHRAARNSGTSAGAKNASQLAMFSPSPCISKYAAGKRQAVSKNAGTSEGVRKAWQKRKHSGVALSGTDLHEAVRDAHGYLKETLGKEPSHQDIAGQLHHEHGIKVHPNKVRDIIAADNSNTPLTGPGSWLHSQGAMTSAEADAAERQAVLRGRLIRHLNKAKRPKPIPTPKAG